MANFLPAIEFVLPHEGGYVTDPADPGGETNFGITKRDFPSLDIKRLTRDKAVAIYRTKYWLSIYKAIQSQDVASKVLDMAVNMGARRAHKLLQRALNAAGEELAVDGAFGPGTLTAVNAASDTLLLPLIRLEAVRFYARLATRRAKLRKFLAGWVNRALA